MLYIKLFIEREKNTGQSAPECPFKAALVKIKGVLQGGSWRAIASLKIFFSFDPPNPPGIKISTPTDPLGKHTETFKITNKIAFIISKSAKSLQTH